MRGNATNLQVFFTSSPRVDTSVIRSVTIETEPYLAQALSCAQGGDCEIGDTGPGGGIVFYVAAGTFTATGTACDTNCKYLEAAPYGWYNGSDDPEMAWSGNVDTQIGSTARNEVVGTGLANTLAILNQNSTAGTAAYEANDYSNNGLSDWYLPAEDELQLMYTNLKQASPSLGQFQNARYWSSTEYFWTKARELRFQDGTRETFGWLKTGNAFDNTPGAPSVVRVRPVRAF